MFIRVLLVVSYIWACIRLRAKPWMYFQLNAQHFNESKGIYSKLDMDRLIPKCWRLPQFMDMGQQEPESFPVFVKPEWGQNSHGILRADNAQELAVIRQSRGQGRFPYLIQQAAKEAREFEIFILPDDKDAARFALLSITEVVNSSDERLPINGIHNSNTRYLDISDQFDDAQKHQVWQHLSQIGPFRISRVGLRADSVEQLLAGQFHIIEINLFVPMPLYLLSEGVTGLAKFRFVRRAMWQLALLTKSIPAQQPTKSVFFKKLRVSRQVKLDAQKEIAG